jgi:hypothetical protein
MHGGVRRNAGVVVRQLDRIRDEQLSAKDTASNGQPSSVSNKAEAVSHSSITVAMRLANSPNRS